MYIIYIYIHMQNVVSVHFWPTDPHLGAIVDDELHRSRLREDLRLTFSFFSTKKTLS